MTNQTIDVLCPTRSRPDGARRMAESALENSAFNNHITLGIDADESRKDEYLKLASDKVSIMECGDGTGAVAVWNVLHRLTHNKYIVMTSDDSVFRTKGWDEKMLKCMPPDDIAVIGCRALENGPENYDSMLLSRRWIDVVGYIGFPLLYHYYAESMHIYMAKALKRRIYCPDVLIEHFHYKRHPAGNRIDDVYRRNEARLDLDRKVYMKNLKVFDDIADKLKGSMYVATDIR